MHFHIEVLILSGIHTLIITVHRNVCIGELMSKIILLCLVMEQSRPTLGGVRMH